MKQIDLTTGDVVDFRSLKIGPAAHGSGYADLAAALPGNLRLGAVGWAWPGWTGLVYQQEAQEATLARSGLSAYALHPLLSTVSFEHTFQHQVKDRVYADLAARVPPGFRFLITANHLCTSPHVITTDGKFGSSNSCFLDPVYASEAVIAPLIEAMGDRLGMLIFRFPLLAAEYIRDSGRFVTALARFLDNLPDGVEYGVELEHREFFNPEYLRFMRGSRASHCYNICCNMPSLPIQLSRCPAQTNSSLCVLWRGRTNVVPANRTISLAPYDRVIDPDPVERAALARLIGATAGSMDCVYCVVDNLAEGCAPLTLAAIAELVAGGRRDRPD